MHGKLLDPFLEHEVQFFCEVTMHKQTEPLFTTIESAPPDSYEMVPRALPYFPLFIVQAFNHWLKF